jgi:hypothetical protein
MPENLNDTAATGKQNQVYKNDREDPQGKPFSRKQREANERAYGRCMRYNEEHPTKGVVFSAEEGIEALENGWFDAPLVHPNCPNVKPKPKAKVNRAATDADLELILLWDEVDRLNISPRPHGKTGIEKLRKIIVEAEKRKESNG